MVGNISVPIGKTRILLKDILNDEAMNNIVVNIFKIMPLQEKRLAIQTGVCSFPDSCNERKTCTKTYCNADVCSNGFAYRMS
jgi:hypothetical protein